VTGDSNAVGEDPVGQRRGGGARNGYMLHGDSAMGAVQDDYFCLLRADIEPNQHSLGPKGGDPPQALPAAFGLRPG